MSPVIRHIYVHIPFCARICPYCAFYKTKPDVVQSGRFCTALLRELESSAGMFQLQPETIYVGGGTPTALSTIQLRDLLSGFRDRLDLSELREWTVEANPGSVSVAKAAALRDLGVTRISLGVQAWQDNLLNTLGREHNAQQAEVSYRILREVDFPSVNIDLMFGIPGQTLSDWEATLARTIALRPNHISAYCLTYEEDTDYFLRHASGEYLQDESADAQFFTTAIRSLTSAGYVHYETSNHAQPGHESLHNRGYWQGADYLGIGPSAFSTVDFKRWQNVPDYRAYADRVLTGDSPIESHEQLTEAIKRSERIALSLRTRDGVPADYLNAWPDERREFIELGLLYDRGSHLVLTEKGKLLVDSVAEAFV